MWYSVVQCSGNAGGGDNLSQGTSEGGAEVIGAPLPDLACLACLLAAELCVGGWDGTGEEQYRGSRERLHL